MSEYTFTLTSNRKGTSQELDSIGQTLTVRNKKNKANGVIVCKGHGDNFTCQTIINSVPVNTTNRSAGALRVWLGTLGCSDPEGFTPKR